MAIRERHMAYTERARSGQPQDLDRYRAMVARHSGPGTRVLHFGCGRDRYGTAAHLMAQGADVHGVELAPEFVESYPAPIWLTDGRRLPFGDRSFDLVCGESIFEHLAHPRPVVAELARVLRPGGHLVALTPNRRSYKIFWANHAPRWLRQLAVDGLGLRDPPERGVHRGHYRMNTPSALRHLAAFHGLEVMDLVLVNNGPTWSRRIPGVFEAGLMLHRAMAHEALAPLRCSILLTLRRRAPWSLPQSRVPSAPASPPLLIRCTACAHTPMTRTDDGWVCPECDHRFLRRGAMMDARGAPSEGGPQKASTRAPEL